jgi:hypothetical protein
MGRSPPSEANSHLAGQEIPHRFTEPEVSLPCSQGPTTGPYPGPDESCPQPPTLFP